MERDVLTAVALGSLAGWIAGRMDGKAQAVRAIDVLALGPFMVFMSTKVEAPKGARFILALAGAATMTYNGRNFLEIRGQHAD